MKKPKKVPYRSTKKKTQNRPDTEKKKETKKVPYRSTKKKTQNRPDTEKKKETKKSTVSEY